VAIAGFYFVVERLAPRAPEQPILRRGIVADAMYIPVQYLMRVLISFVAADVLTDATSVLAPGAVSLLAGRPIALQVVVVVVVLDFFFYVMHRLKHRWHWWWRLHETHHSSEQMDFLSSVRFHPLEKLLDRLVFLLPLAVLGPDDPALLAWSGIDVFFGMLNHSNTRIRLGPLHALFVGPEMHLWHHAADPRRRECNYGNNLSIFDWMFGTARLHAGNPPWFGVGAADYPQDDILRQFLYAFRPREEAASATGTAGAALDDAGALAGRARID
jgi:sterol desaturase/sphingolipid hydroxylase (fatty acid hydroxylase superfamily)